MLNIHESKLQSPYFEYVRDRVKIYETRVWDEKRKRMNIGDLWYFTHSSDSGLEKIKTRIVEVKIYSSFREAIVDSGVAQLLPQISDLEQAISIYESFDNGNYKIDAEKFGVVRFRIELVT